MNQPEEGYEVSNIGYEELIKMFELAFDEEQWSYDQESVDAYYSIDNKGFFKGVIGDKMISIILAVRYPDNFAYIGYFLVRHANRRKNNGRVLFDKALEHCKGCVTGIFGVHSLIPFYQKKGFTISEYARMYTGKSAKVDIKLPILPYNEEEHYNDIAEYDKNCFPGDRKEFLKRWLKKSNALTFVYYDSNKKLKGYASIFKSNVEWDISPCY